MRATFVPGTPEVTRTVVEKPATPAKVQLEMTVEAAAWILLFVGHHNGTSENNPVNGVFGDLHIPQVVAVKQKLESRFDKVMADFAKNARPGPEAAGGCVMPKFRKKPVVIEAVQVTDSTFDAPHPNPEHIPGVVYDPTLRCAFIDTLEGRMRADKGDWIITGVKGEHYPCKPDIFAATYEPATEGAA